MSITVNNGDVVLVTFPYTDLTATKLRPALVISTPVVHKQEADYTLLFISSVLSRHVPPYEVVFKRGHVDFKASGLKQDSVFKCHKLVTLQHTLIRRRLGKLGKTIRRELVQAWATAINIAGE